MPIIIATPEETRERFKQRGDTSTISFLSKKRKQKPGKSHGKKSPRPTVIHHGLAKPDDPIYSTGFVIGGRSLKKPREDN